MAKFLLTIGAVIVLLVHTNAMQEAASRVSGVAVETLSSAGAHLGVSGAVGHLGDLQLQLVVAAGAGLLVLLTTTTLGVYKPCGRTGYGQRKVSQP